MANVVFIALTAIACSSSIKTPDSSARQIGLRDGLATLSGQVLLDGQPIKHFGVVLSQDAKVTVFPPPTDIVSDDGRFKIVGVKPGVHDVIIVGRGFARHVVPKAALKAGETYDLKQVHVHPGFVVEGIVVDTAGKPLKNAVVKIKQTATTGYTESQDMAAGNHATTTDENGYFVFGGITTVEPTRPLWQTFAVVRGLGSSLPEWLTAGNHSLRLTVVATGIVSGLVEGSFEGIVIARSVALGKAVMYGTIVDQSYSIELPFGEYDLSVFKGKVRYKRIRVKVVSGTITADFLRGP